MTDFIEIRRVPFPVAFVIFITKQENQNARHPRTTAHKRTETGVCDKVKCYITEDLSLVIK